MARDLLAKLEKGVLILDGATGTQLQKQGLPGGVCTETWILEHPDTILNVQSSYKAAGSMAVMAPTFGANRAVLAANGCTLPISQLCTALVALSRRAVGDDVLVAGDISPTGHQLYPLGDLSFDDAVDIYSEQARALEAGGVDYYVIETQMSLAEARAAVLAVRAVSDKPIVVSFSCTENGKTLFGEDLTSVLISLQDMGIAAFGINCCGNIPLLISLLERLYPYASVPLLAKPNAGIPILTDAGAVYPLTAEEMAAYVPALIDAGARLIGGCCGTDSDHIAAISQAAAGCLPRPVAPTVTKVCASPAAVLALDTPCKIEPLPLTEDILDDMDEAEASDAFEITISSQEDLDVIRNYQYAIRKPLFVCCGDGDLLAEFLRIYNGKPVIL